MRPGDAWGYRPALDGVRALAVTLVVLFHAGMLEFGGGFVGVDLFFVLSGYLVTTILLTELGSTGTIRLRRFYARRIRRLLPAAIVLVVATSAAWVLIAPITQRIELVGDARAALLYVANWSFIARSTDYFATDAEQSPFIHFWSLSIEEQFYFIFPLLLIVLYRLRPRFGRHGRRVVPGALIAICAVSLLFQLAWAGSDPTRAYYGTEARFYQLAAGALLAVRLRRMPDRSRGGPGDRFLAWAGALGLLVLGSGMLDMSPALRGILATLLSVALVAGLERSPAGRVGLFFSRPPLVYLGRISYATYLWHWPIILFLGTLLDVEPWVMALLALPLATAMAALSAELIELPIRRAPRLDRFPRIVIAAGLVTSLAVAVAIPVILEADRRPAIAGGEQDPWLFLPDESPLPSLPPVAEPTPAPTDAPTAAPTVAPASLPPASPVPVPGSTDAPIVPLPSDGVGPAAASPGPSGGPAATPPGATATPPAPQPTAPIAATPAPTPTPRTTPTPPGATRAPVVPAPTPRTTPRPTPVGPLGPIDRVEPTATPAAATARPSARPAASTAPSPSATSAPLTRAEMERVLASLGPVPTGIDWKAAREYDTTVWTCPPGKVRECLVVDGTGPTVLFVGDSSARTLMPAMTRLAKERGFRLYASILPACSWMAGVRRPDISDDALCVAQREDWYARAIPAIDPDVVVLHERGYRAEVDESTARAADRGVDALPIGEQERVLAERTLDLLTPLAGRVVIIEPFPTDYGKDPTECLSGSRRIASCAFVDRPVRIEETLRALVPAYPGVALADLDRVVCPTYPLCVPYQDGRVIWRDGTHIATGTWDARRREVWQALRATGAFTGTGD